MKILLVGEASRVHRNLKIGLTSFGAECRHVTQSDSTSWREFDDTFAPAHSGVLGGLARNVSPFIKISRLDDYDVINFTNTITAVHGKYTKYLDIPWFRKKTKLMSYYALGCDEIGLIRKNEMLPYRPCVTCLESKDTLSRDCDLIFNPRYEKSQDLTRRYFDFAACSMIEYGHVEELFGGNFSRIQFPVDISRIPFSPAKSRPSVNIIHTPTRRGFKGTSTVLQAVEILKKRRNDFKFDLIEGLSYEAYISRISEADIVVDQIYSQSPGMNGLEMMAAGKIVLTGATTLGRSYFGFMNESPAFDAPPEALLLADQLDQVIDRKNEFSDLAERGRSYVEINHSLIGVAEKFLNEWSARI
ncbi:MAG: hypothetical protein Q8K21_03130 [Hydrogenophaga sp.]|nr:hypothetical protein [Hydrogenophaga sp.]MDP2163205.1 hypothetical protein [Hydrogenophaga sp.]